MDVHCYSWSVRIGCQRCYIFCLQDWPLHSVLTSSAAVQASVEELRSSCDLAEVLMAASQAELAAAQEHARLLQEMLQDTQVLSDLSVLHIHCKATSPKSVYR